jgi:hydroxyethylthiazole kinase-like uncharacterized protein yjeF
MKGARTAEASVEAAANGPQLWLAAFPFPSRQGHKYSRGHVLAVSGPMTRTGAARLAARAALRAGAGLVTLASPPDALAVNAAQLTAIMLREMLGPEGLAAILDDRRINAVVLGPALGVGKETRRLVRVALEAGRAVVIDADGLTSFAENPGELFGLVGKSSGQTVITPHEGEFARLTGAPPADRIASARSLALEAGAVTVLKGPRTVIAAPDGRAAINANAPPTLATAGSGDVLAGIICGLMAQGMPAFEAACAGVWLHGAAAEAHGPGLISEDIENHMPAVLARIEALPGSPRL